MRALQRAVDFVTKALAELTDSSLLGVDDEGRDVVRVAPMPNTAIHQAQVGKVAAVERLLQLIPGC